MDKKKSGSFASCVKKYGPESGRVILQIPNSALPYQTGSTLDSRIRKTRVERTGELEKVDNHYKYKGATFGVEKSQQVVTHPADRETLEDVAMAVARQISIAENLEQEAIKACEETDKISELLDESSARQELAKELLERFQFKMSNTISLKSSDGDSFPIDEEAAKLSLKLKTIIDQKDDLVRNISSITLSKVIEYCSKHVPNNNADEEALKLFDQELVNNVDKLKPGELLLILNSKDLKPMNEMLVEVIDQAFAKRCSGGPS
ncbi:SKP1-like protein 14 [Artemisia annua]|uniref:SKP1-like protein 14 n=1 Tax=Artemisia annua TaxID=35608 RepID=A0A2U1P7L5_ARTAN|nr:SKP1-like protein 14 [Artemisia annua]